MDEKEETLTEKHEKEEEEEEEEEEEKEEEKPSKSKDSEKTKKDKKSTATHHPGLFIRSIHTLESAPKRAHGNQKKRGKTKAKE